MINRAADTIGLDSAKSTAVVQGYGNVGSIAAHTLARYGVKVIAISDVNGGLFNPKGLDLIALDKFLAENKSIAGFPDGDPITYVWMFGDASPPQETTSPTVNHTFTQAGIYSAQLVVRDSSPSGKNAVLSMSTFEPGPLPM